MALANSTDLGVIVLEEKVPLLEKPKAKKIRVRSIDAARGLTMLLNVFCATTGIYLPNLTHAKWNGLQLADVVHPWFLMIMGYAMAYACKRKDTFDQNFTTFKKAFVRFLKLVGLSLWLEGLRSRDGPITPLFKLWVLLFTDPFHYFHILRYFGILSRIGVCFIFVIAVHLFLPKMSFPTKSSGWNILKYNTSGWSLIMFLFLIHFFVILYQYPEGCEMHRWQNAEGPNTCNIIAHIDSSLVGKNHLYDMNAGFDPEGFFAALPSMLTVFAGLHIGESMRMLRPERFLLETTIITALFIIVGFLLNTYGNVPYNKPMWSASFNLMTMATCNAVLIVFYLFLDYPSWRRSHDSFIFRCVDLMTQPLRWVGMNSILIWCSMLMFTISVKTFEMLGIYPTPNSPAIFFLGLSNVAVYAAWAGYLYRRKYFVKL